MLRETIYNILKKYEIDDNDRFALLFEIMEAFEGARPASDEWKRICAAHESREQAEKVMLDRLEKVLGITPNSRPEWVSIARFLIEKESDAETIETFAANCKLDPYNTPKKHQIAKDPMQIKANWKHVIAISTPKDDRDYLRGLPEEEAAEEEVATPVLTAIDKAWMSVLEQLEMDMPKTTFAVHLLGTRPLDYRDSIFQVDIGSRYSRDWLKARMTSTVNRLLAGILNDPDVRVEFAVNP